MARCQRTKAAAASLTATRDGDPGAMDSCRETAAEQRGRSEDGPVIGRAVRRRLEFDSAGASASSSSMQTGVMAMNEGILVDVAREGPGDPPPHRATVTVTRHHVGAFVAETVAAGGEAAGLQLGPNAREAKADRGKAAAGPPCGTAAPQADTTDTTCGPQGRVSPLTSQEMPLTASGGRPLIWQSVQPPQDMPARLGEGPSIHGRALLDENGGRPARGVSEEAGRQRRPRGSGGGSSRQRRRSHAEPAGGALKGFTQSCPRRSVFRVPEHRGAATAAGARTAAAAGGASWCLDCLF